MGELDGSYTIIGGANNFPALQKLTIAGGGGANQKFSPQPDTDLQIIGGATFTPKTLIGELNCPSLYITSHLTFKLGKLVGELIIGIGGAIAPPSSPLEPPMCVVCRTG